MKLNKLNFAVDFSNVTTFHIELWTLYVWVCQWAGLPVTDLPPLVQESPLVVLPSQCSVLSDESGFGNVVSLIRLCGYVKWTDFTRAHTYEHIQSNNFRQRQVICCLNHSQSYQITISECLHRYFELWPHLGYKTNWSQIVLFSVYGWTTCKHHT